VHRKVHHVDRLADIFGTAMKNRWARRAYVELFAGPGLSYDRTAHHFVEGSARRAIGRDFTDYVFVDVDRRATDALGERLRRDGVTKPHTILTSDCNAAIPQIRAALPSKALSLVFVDPTNWQITFESIRNLVFDRRTDLLFTFQVGAMRRVGGVAAPALDAFFGTTAWRRALKEPRERRSRALVEIYNEQLQPLGYRDTPFEMAVPVKNSRGVTMYLLVLFSKHPLGVKFWGEAMSVDESGQRSLWELVG
jgi:three-Cys-motif partner protein